MECEFYNSHVTGTEGKGEHRMDLTYIGISVLVLGALIVFLNKTVTTGHAVLFGFGAVLLALPHISNLEVSEGALKFTTREQSADLAAQVKAVSEQNAQLAKNLVEVGKAVDSTNLRMQAIEDAMQRLSPGTSFTPDANVSPEFLRDLMFRNEQIGKTSQETIKRLDHLQKELVPPSAENR